MSAARSFNVLLLAALTVSGSPPVAQASRSALLFRPAAQNTAATPKAVTAANAFLATLNEQQRVKAVLPLNETTRIVWSNLPTGTTMQVGATERNGLKLGAMSAAQQDAALALVAAALSRSGYRKVMNIVNADQQLEVTSAPQRGAGNRVRFGRAEYYVAILGSPSADARWMLQFGGHHLAINVTMAGRQSVLTPTHTGAQPATYTLNGQTIRPLGSENDKAFKLVNTLDDSQRKQALLGYEVRNLVLGPGEDGKTIQPEGVRASTFNQDQRALLLDLIREWVDILDESAAAAKMSEVTSKLADTWFAWSGSTAPGGLAYFRIQGPTVFIEYAPQGSPRPSNDHIHTIYRDPTNDYGARLSAR
jgi:Protein of unknown function (DUF3500)